MFTHHILRPPPLRRQHACLLLLNCSSKACHTTSLRQKGVIVKTLMPVPSLLASQSVPEWSTSLSNTSIVLSGSSVESRGGRTVTLHGMSSSHPQPTWQPRARTALMRVCQALQQQRGATCQWLRHRSRSRRNNTPQTKNNNRTKPLTHSRQRDHLAQRVCQSLWSQLVAVFSSSSSSASPSSCSSSSSFRSTISWSGSFTVVRSYVSLSFTVFPLFLFRLVSEVLKKKFVEPQASVSLGHDTDTKRANTAKQCISITENETPPERLADEEVHDTSHHPPLPPSHPPPHTANPTPSPPYPAPETPVAHTSRGMVVKALNGSYQGRAFFFLETPKMSTSCQLHPPTQHDRTQDSPSGTAANTSTDVSQPETCDEQTRNQK